MRQRRSPQTLLGAATLVLLLTSAAAAPYLAPHDPTAQNLAINLAGPSRAHPCGLDKLGRDVLSRIIYGARVSATVGLATVAVSLSLGLLVGGVAGYAGGPVDEAISRSIDVLLAFPGLLLAIALAAVLGPSLHNVVLALCVLGWTGYARLVRGEVIALREREFVQAARALGAGPARILLRHLLPPVVPALLVEATFGMAGAVVAEASLSFLGLGVPPPLPSWGSMLSEGRNFLLVAPHLTIFPALAVTVTVVGLNFLGDGLRDLWDVRRA